MVTSPRQGRGRGLSRAAKRSSRPASFGSASSGTFPFGPFPFGTFLVGSVAPVPSPRLAPAPNASSPLGQLITDPLGALTRWAHQALQLAISHLPLVVGLTVAGIALLASVRWLRVRLQRRHLLPDRAQIVHIQVPPQVEAAAAAALWANLIGLLRPRWRRVLFGQPHVAFEYHWDGPQLHLGMWVPGCIPAALVARAVEAAWPAARTTLTAPRPLIPDRPDRSGGVVVTGGVLRLARPDHHPIATSHTMTGGTGRAADPIRALLGAAAGIAPGQHAVVQVLARPATGRRLARAACAAAHLRGTHRPTLTGRIFDLLTPGAAGRPSTTRHAVAAAYPERAAEIRAILDKAAAPRFEVIVRYAAATTHTTDPEAARAFVRGRAHALASAFAVHAGRNHFERHRLRRPLQALDSRQMGRGYLLSTAELAAIAHLPHDPAVPGLARAGANTIPPPPAVPAGGWDTKPLGTADAGAARPVAIHVADARHHLHVVGATGSGKSTLLAHLILADAHAGRAAVIIDPRGDLVGDLLARLPEKVAGRVWLIDPDTTPPPALNVLTGTDPHVTSDNLVGIIRRIFADSWGPRTDDILRSAILTLQHLPGATLADIPRLLTDEPYRLRATRRLTTPTHHHQDHHQDGGQDGGHGGGQGGGDEILAGFWTWYTALSAEARANAIGPVMNKLRHFLLRPFIRHIIGTPGPGLSMRRLLDTGGILLVRVPKGTLGDDTARLLGSLVLAKIWEATTARAHQPETERRDAALYIDEAHAFLNLPHGIEEMLAEARAYRLSVTLAHQNLTQFPPHMRDAVAANARNKIIFNLSPHDAHNLAKATWPHLTDHDLANLGAYQAAARLIVNATETPAFTLTTRPLPHQTPGRAESLRQAARNHAQVTHRPPRLPDPRRDHNPSHQTQHTGGDSPAHTNPPSMAPVDAPADADARAPVDPRDDPDTPNDYEPEGLDGLEGLDGPPPAHPPA